MPLTRSPFRNLRDLMSATKALTARLNLALSSGLSFLKSCSKLSVVDQVGTPLSYFAKRRKKSLSVLYVRVLPRRMSSDASRSASCHVGVQNQAWVASTTFLGLSRIPS